MKPLIVALPVLVAALLSAGCASVERAATKKLADTLAGGGTVFAADDDPELIRDAAPFSLKLMESVLATVPDHAGLRLAAASGFTQYAYAFVQPEAEILADTDFAAAEAVRQRARRLYLRARDHGLQALAVRHPDLPNRLRTDPRGGVRACKQADVPALYWTAAAWGAAIATGKDHPELLADLPALEALIDRALELDEAWDHGAIHSFLIAYELVRPGGAGDPVVRARRHFERARELSGDAHAGPFVTFAESVCVQQQDRAEFTALLGQALAIDPDARPEWRLVNLILQARARRLLARVDDLFLPAEAPSAP